MKLNDTHRRIIEVVLERYKDILRFHEDDIYMCHAIDDAAAYLALKDNDSQMNAAAHRMNAVVYQIAASELREAIIFAMLSNSSFGGYMTDLSKQCGVDLYGHATKMFKEVEIEHDLESIYHANIFANVMRECWLERMLYIGEVL